MSNICKNAMVNDILKFVELNFKDKRKDLIICGKTLVERLECDVREWTSLYNQGQISEDELKSLIAGQKNLIELEVLKVRGLAKVAMDEMINGVINIVISHAIKI